MNINSDFQSLNIRTPEGVVFSLQLAGPVVRMLALLVDMATIAVITSVVRTVMGYFFVITPDFATALLLIIYFAVTIGYGICFEWMWNGQTLGKRLLRLRVADENGHHLHFSQIAVRNLLRFVDSLPSFYLIGGITTLFNRRAQRLGDLAAGTIVIRQPRVNMPDIEQIGKTKYNSFNEHPYLEARLRSLVSPQETSLALSALLRRNELDDTSRLALFRELTNRIKQKTPFPPELIEDLSDEQFVRNVICSIYRLSPRQNHIAGTSS